MVSQNDEDDIDNSDKNGSDCLENEARASRNFGRKMTLSPQ